MRIFGQNREQRTLSIVGPLYPIGTLTPLEALKNPTVYAGVRVLADAAASCPLIVYRCLGDRQRAGTRAVPLLPALRRLLAAWELKSPHTRPIDLVIATAAAEPVQERNLRRALEDAKTAAGLADMEERLSWHSLRHSFASMLATDLELPATTLARLTGHADAGFTLRVYARDRRDETAVVSDVLARASGAGVGV